MFLDYLFFELTKRSLKNKPTGYTRALGSVSAFLSLNLFTIYLCAVEVLDRMGYDISDGERFVFPSTMLLAGLYTYTAHKRSNQIVNRYTRSDEKEDMTFALIYYATSVACFLFIAISTRK